MRISIETSLIRRGFGMDFLTREVSPLSAAIVLNGFFVVACAVVGLAL